MSAVESELAPLRLPAEYRRLIERIGPAVPLVGFPTLHHLAFGLNCWLDDRKFAWVPKVLFTIAYDALRTGHRVGYDVADWPEHWQRAEGIVLEGLAPIGATASVADFVETRNAGAGQERIHVSVVGLFGTGSAGIRR